MAFMCLHVSPSLWAVVVGWCWLMVFVGGNVDAKVGGDGRWVCMASCMLH